jgi:multidrug efflux pump subunit AcrA (membrane-fusion protein)
MAVRKNLIATRPLADIFAAQATLRAEMNAIHKDEREAQAWADEQLASAPGWRDLTWDQQQTERRKAFARLEREGRYRERLAALDRQDGDLRVEMQKHPGSGATMTVTLSQGEIKKLAAFCEGYEGLRHQDLAAQIIRAWLNTHEPPTKG